MVRSPIAGQKPQVGAQSTEVRRLMVFATIGMALTLGALLMFAETASSGEGSWVGPEGENKGPRVEIPYDIYPWNTHAKKLNEGLTESGEQGRLALDRGEMINLLAKQLALRPHAHFKYDEEFSEVGGFERVDPVVLAKPDNADTYRGRPVELVGTILTKEWANPASYELDEEVFKPQLPLMQGTLRTEEGVVVKFLLSRNDSRVDPLFLDKKFQAKRHKVMGVFYRIVEDAEGTIMPFVLASKVTPALPLVPVDVLSDDLGERIAKAEEEHLDRAPQLEPEFLELAGFVIKKGKDAIPEGEEPILLRGREPRDEPEQFRLKPVRVKGILIYLRRESFEYEDMRPEDAPTLGYWHAIVSDEDPEKNVPQSILFPFDELPEELERWSYAKPTQRAARPHIDVTGIYYRLHSYEAIPEKRRKREVHIPVVVAVAQPVVTEGMGRPPTDTNSFMVPFIAVGSGIAIVLMMMLARDRRKAARLEEHLRASRQKRRQSAGMDLNQPVATSGPDATPDDS